MGSSGGGFGGGLGGSVGGFALGGSLCDLAGLAMGSETPRGGTRRFFTCTVGRKPSAANFFVDDTEEVSELLVALKQQMERRLTGQAGSDTWRSDSSGGKHAPLSEVMFSPPGRT